MICKFLQSRKHIHCWLMRQKCYRLKRYYSILTKLFQIKKRQTNKTQLPLHAPCPPLKPQQDTRDLKPSINFFLKHQSNEYKQPKDIATCLSIVYKVEKECYFSKSPLLVSHRGCQFCSETVEHWKQRQTRKEKVSAFSSSLVTYKWTDGGVLLISGEHTNDTLAPTSVTFQWA